MNEDEMVALAAQVHTSLIARLGRQSGDESAIEAVLSILARVCEAIDAECEAVEADDPHGQLRVDFLSVMDLVAQEAMTFLAGLVPAEAASV